MEYYNPIDHSSKRYAAVITVVVMALISLGVSFVTFEIERHNNEIYAVEIEYVEELEEEPEQKTPPAARAEQTCHSTARQAAEMARLSGAKQLLIGHFSARYTDEQLLLDEARTVFPETFLAEEGKCFKL